MLDDMPDFMRKDQGLFDRYERGSLFGRPTFEDKRRTPGFKLFADPESLVMRMVRREDEARDAIRGDYWLAEVENPLKQVLWEMAQGGSEKKDDEEDESDE